MVSHQGSCSVQLTYRQCSAQDGGSKYSLLIRLATLDILLHRSELAFLKAVLILLQPAASIPDGPAEPSVCRAVLGQEYVAHTEIVFSTGALHCTRTNGLLKGQKHGTAHLCFCDTCVFLVCFHFLLVKLLNFVNVQTNMF